MCLSTTQQSFVPEQYFFSRIPAAQRTIFEFGIRTRVAQHPEDKALMGLIPGESRQPNGPGQYYASLVEVLEKLERTGSAPSLSFDYYIEAARMLAASGGNPGPTVVTEIELPLQQLESPKSDPGFFCQYEQGQTRIEKLKLTIVNNPLGAFAIVDGLSGSEECRLHPEHDLTSGLWRICAAGSDLGRQRADAAVSELWRAFWRSLETGQPYTVERKCLPHPEDQ